MSICALFRSSRAHHIFILGFLGRNQVQPNCLVVRPSLCWSPVSGHRASGVSEWTLAKQSRHHGIQTGFTGFEALQVRSVQTLLHLRHGALLHEHLLVPDLLVQHLLVVRLAVLLVLCYVRLDFTPNSCNLHI